MANDVVETLIEERSDYCVITGDETNCPACKREKEIREIIGKMKMAESAEELDGLMVELWGY